MIEYLLIAGAFITGFSYKRFCRHVGVFFFVVSALLANPNPVTLVFLLVGALSLVINRNAKPEEASLVVFLVAGSIGIINAIDLFYIYIFFEIALIASYFLLFRKNKENIMALSRYFVMNSIGTAFVLFGLAMLWSSQGTFLISNIQPDIYSIFLFIGFATKMGLVPFHMWLPRTYDVAKPSTLILFAGILNKIGVLGIYMFLPAISSHLNLTLAIISILSMTVANLSALSERNIKRLLAYSSIAHMSYILFGFVTGASLGAIVHVVGHALAITCAFICAGIMVEKFKTKDLRKLRGAATANRFIAFAFLISILTLAGIPLFPLFVSELLILISSYSYNIWLTAAFGFNLVLSIAYYVNLIKMVELKETDKRIKLSREQKFVIIFLVLLILLVGIFPDMLVQMSSNIL